MDPIDNELSSSILSSGIPRTIESVLPLEEENDELVYRNVEVMSSYSLHTRLEISGKHDVLNAGVGKSSFFDGVCESSPNAVFRPMSAEVSRPARALRGRLGKHHMSLEESLSEAKQRVQSFLSVNNVSSTSRQESETHIWSCYFVTAACQLLKFSVLVSQQPGDSVVVEFRRDRGTEGEDLSTLFDLFQCSCGKTPKASRSRVIPPLKDDEPPNEDEVEGALAALSTWLISNASEALQCIGQMCCNKSAQVLRSENILSDLCKVAAAHSKDEDLVILALALCSIRLFVQNAAVVGSSVVLNVERVTYLRDAVARAMRSSDLSARREAILAVPLINSAVSSEHKIEI
jgi:hypothetical protein